MVGDANCVAKYFSDRFFIISPEIRNSVAFENGNEKGEQKEGNAGQQQEEDKD